MQQVFEMTLFRGLFLLHFGVHLLEIDSDNWKFQFYRLEEVTLEEQYNASYPCCSSYNSLAIHWNTKCCCWSTAQIKATGWNWNAFIRTGPKEPRGSSNFLFFSLFLISLLFFFIARPKGLANCTVRSYKLRLSSLTLSRPKGLLHRTNVPS